MTKIINIKPNTKVFKQKNPVLYKKFVDRTAWIMLPQGRLTALIKLRVILLNITQ